jgi:hypothetical protein
VAIPALLTCAAERQIVQHRDIILYNCRLADNDTMPVVDHHILTGSYCRMDVDGKALAHLALQVLRDLDTPFPKPMGEAVRLQPLATLKMQERHDQAPRYRITLAYSVKIGECGFGDRRLGYDCLLREREQRAHR